MSPWVHLFQPFGIFMPIYIASAFTIAWRKSLKRPWLFLALGSLLIAIDWTALYNLLTMKVYTAPAVYRIVPGPEPPPSVPTLDFWADWLIHNEVEIAVLVTAYPLLWLVRRPMRKALQPPT